MIKIAPSILSADFSILKDELNSINNADFLHIDVMDGHFVPNITIGYPVVESIRKRTDMLFDVHLMISHPLSYIEQFAKSGSDYITFHVECSDNISDCINLVKKCGKKAGLSLSPDTDCSALIPYIDDISIITIMSVYPGFGGQKFIESSYKKVETIKKMIGNRAIILSIDGGVTIDNVRKLEELGISMVVAGSTVFNSDDRIDMIERLRGE
jgi:ribulose-phosphate 3-epimerase